MLAAKVEEIAKAKGVTPARLAIAWVLAQGEDLVPIPGTKRRAYLEENAAAVDVTLDAEDLEFALAELVEPRSRLERSGEISHEGLDESAGDGGSQQGLAFGDGADARDELLGGSVFEQESARAGAQCVEHVLVEIEGG